jgi:hypothetical protein
MATDDKKPVGLLAIDIERTGRYADKGVHHGNRDLTFAVGFADAPINASAESDIHANEVILHLNYRQTIGDS